MARKRRVIEEEHENHERWLVSYADMITVLMALFIVLFAMSQVDDTKYQELKESLRSGFGQSGAMMHEKASVLDGQGSTALDPIVPDDDLSQLSPEQVKLVDRAVTRKETLAQQRRAADAENEADRFEEVLARLRTALAAHNLEDDVRATIDDRGLVVSMVSRHVVFHSDLATLTRRGQLVIDTLSPVLADLPDALQIDGHTNQARGKPKHYASDWDLASARAITVLRRLSEQGGISAERLSATSYGMERPLIDPKKSGSQQVNKRVDIVVLTSLPPESRELLSEHGFGAAQASGENAGESS
ncbi:MAG TPA: flagellar motor protein MotB [Nocardioides sp.]|uniref:Chemotaxis protein MotB n=1 Tax=Nocardioides daedukensis TaxID=634462 RepID=A0A7Y9S1F0_9ACTN|nr:flagellar motor protein MotB [Nocardioides daedukensis]NYG58727.1 chemotaxis protein MotB [Nocardioides daedukensis]